MKWGDQSLLQVFSLDLNYYTQRRLLAPVLPTVGLRDSIVLLLLEGKLTSCGAEEGATLHWRQERKKQGGMMGRVCPRSRLTHPQDRARRGRKAEWARRVVLQWLCSTILFCPREAWTSRRSIYWALPVCKMAGGGGNERERNKKKDR